MFDKSSGLAGGKIKGNSFLREIISLLLLVAIIYFGIKGAMFLAFRTSSPMMGVTSDSMSHPDGSWRSYYEANGYDPSQFPFTDGIQTGDLVVVRGVSSLDDIEVGDVIIWQKSKKRIIHRVAEKENDSDGVYLRTRSDKYEVQDPVKIRFEDIIGEAVFSIPYLGYPSIGF